jgi:hypothetical protein
VAVTPAPDVSLNPLQGDARPLESWVTMFHLALVVLDPFTHESSWLIETAGRVMRSFTGADCRVAWLVTANEDQTAEFMGPWADEMLTFADPDREMVKALGLESLPAFVHLDLDLNVIGAAEGWNPDEWRDVATGLATAMSWTRPAIPGPGDPTPYAGTPALG